MIEREQKVQRDAVAMNLKIEEIYEVETDRVVPVAMALPARDKDRFDLRRVLADAYQQHKAGYEVDGTWRCPCCLDLLLLIGRSSGTFYIRHPPRADNLCPYKSGRSLTLQQWNAIRYNGALESKRHISLKNLVAELLRATPYASNVFIEPTVRGEDKARWRRPDVLAQVGQKQIAFEIQLSSTYLSVIIEREKFYSQSGRWVLWVFDRFEDKGQRFAEKDIYYANNRNAFELSQSAIEKSFATGELHLECHYLQPRIKNGSILYPWQSVIIALNEITFCEKTHRVFFYDVDQAEAQARSFLIKAERAACFLDPLIKVIQQSEGGVEYPYWALHPFMSELKELGLTPAFTSVLPTGVYRMLEAIASFKAGRLVGSLKNNWLYVGNQILNSYPEHASAFTIIGHHYGVMENLNAQASFIKKKAALRAGRKAGQEKLKENRTWWPLFQALVPEGEWGRASN